MQQTLVIDGIRCFRDKQQIPIKPVTLLVGENSAGKSTVLAMLRAAWDVDNIAEPDFNEEPFNLGSYNTIAHYHGGQGKRAQEFHIGSKAIGGTKKDIWLRRIEGTFKEEAGQPALTYRDELASPKRPISVARLADSGFVAQRSYDAATLSAAN